MIKLNEAPMLNTIQVAAEVSTALRSMQPESVFLIVTKTEAGYDLYGGKGGIVEGQLMES